jgi:hypothetical protein
MVILQPEDTIKVKTVKQIAIITKLLQSSYFSKREFIELMKRNRNQIVTSYDASVLISYLISALKFRRKFLSKKHKAHLKCDYCKAKKYLTRYVNLEFNAQRIMCIACEDKYEELRVEQAELAEKNAKTITNQMHTVDEKQEVAADLHRKYDYNNANSDVEQAYADKQEAKAVVKQFNELSDEQKEACLPSQNKPLGLQ